MGSALKACVIAQGDADVYPRLGLTSEWDTCASHCILNEAGGQLIDCAGVELHYNKPSVLNPWFLAIGDSNVDWLRFCPPQPTQG
jgi:3'(2'), 5'-bisphosphate nucleotidase